MQSCIFYKCLVGDIQFHAISTDGGKFSQIKLIQRILRMIFSVNCTWTCIITQKKINES